MCISVPARVVAIKGQQAQVEVYSQRREVYLTVDDVVVGDWVLVYGPVALTRLDQVEAEETIRLLNGLTTEIPRND